MIIFFVMECLPSCDYFLEFINIYKLDYGKKYDNEFKLMIVELLKSGSNTKQLGEEHGLNSGMISRWKREFTAKSGYFSKKKVLSSKAQKIKILKKIKRCNH